MGPDRTTMLLIPNMRRVPLRAIATATPASRLDRRLDRRPDRRLGGPLLAVAVAICLNTAAVWPGVTQTGRSQAPQVQAPQTQATEAPSQPAPDQPTPPSRPGFVDEIQKLLPAPSWPSIGSPQETIESLNRRAKDAGDNLSRLSKQEVVSGRVKCPLAVNGAPDCKSAANRLCVDAGFKEGRSIDSDSAEDCPASVLLSDKTPPAPAECRVENFVIRALCQR